MILVVAQGTAVENKARSPWEYQLNRCSVRHRAQKGCWQRLAMTNPQNFSGHRERAERAQRSQSVSVWFRVALSVWTEVQRVVKKSWFQKWDQNMVPKTGDVEATPTVRCPSDVPRNTDHKMVPFFWPRSCPSIFFVLEITTTHCNSEKRRLLL